MRRANRLDHQVEVVCVDLELQMEMELATDGFRERARKRADEREQQIFIGGRKSGRPSIDLASIVVEKGDNHARVSGGGVGHFGRRRE